MQTSHSTIKKNARILSRYLTTLNMKIILVLQHQKHICSIFALSILVRLLLKSIDELKSSYIYYLNTTSLLALNP